MMYVISCLVARGVTPSCMYVFTLAENDDLVNRSMQELHVCCPLVSQSSFSAIHSNLKVL